MMNDNAFGKFLLILVLIGGVSMSHLSSIEAKSQPPWYDNSYALIIGVNEYTHGWPKLESARHDAELMEKELKRRGFQVFVLYDEKATKRNILRVLQTELPPLIKETDRLIIYFAGHGQTQTTPKKNKVGYIVPSDGEISQSQDQWHSYLSISELKGVLHKHIQNKHALMIFDSCFSGLMFARGVIRRPQFKAQDYLNLNGVMGITSGSENQLAQDGLFTRLFLEGLQGNADQNQDGIINFQELSFFVRNEVKNQNDQQEPQFGILSGLGQMIFKTKPGRLTHASSAPNQLQATIPSSRPLLNYKLLAGGASLVLGGGLLAYTLSEAKEIQAITSTAEYNERLRQDKASLQTQHALGWVGIGLGATLLTMWIFDTPAPSNAMRSSPSFASFSRSTPLITPIVHEQRQGVMASWSF